MKLRFTKMHGQGNDFMMVDAVRQSVQFTPDIVKALSNRFTGIGFDQLLIVESADKPGIDFRYRIYNADGGEVQQCGNGARCFVRFAREVGLTDKHMLRVQTMNGEIELRQQGDTSADVTVDMGRPIFEPNRIPLQWHGDPDIQYPLTVRGKVLNVAALSMGNPHAVLMVDDVDQTPVSELGPAIQTSGYFPEGVNVGFLQVIDRSTAKLRVYERGSGETLACGSGACAAVVAGIRWGLLDHTVRVLVRGGELSVTWRGESVLMSGGTAVVFHGEVDLSG
jgi:diaminopimelate epimerase